MAIKLEEGLNGLAISGGTFFCGFPKAEYNYAVKEEIVLKNNHKSRPDCSCMLYAFEPGKRGFSSIKMYKLNLHTCKHTFCEIYILCSIITNYKTI